MGWHGITVRVSVLLDAHAGEKEKRHDELYAQFLMELAKLCDKYEEIRAELL